MRNRIQRVLDPKSAEGRRQEAALAVAIVADTDDAIIAKALDGTILSWNTGAQRIFGYTCLLYTSPSPRDGLLSRMPSSA